MMAEGIREYSLSAVALVCSTKRPFPIGTSSVPAVVAIERYLFREKLSPEQRYSFLSQRLESSEVLEALVAK